jgi:hypothetical protein
MLNDNRTDYLSRLEAILLQEATASPRCFDYFSKKQNAHGNIDGSCRKAMVTWIQQVQTTLSLSPNTVYIAMSIFDRYLSSGKGNSTSVLKEQSKFQLAAITAFYTAIKIHEPIVLGLDMLLVLCRNAYSEADFISMEVDILTAIEWRVSYHTAMDVARTLLELIRDDGLLSSVDVDRLIKGCESGMSTAIAADIRSSCCKPSELGIRCVEIALGELSKLTATKKEAICIRMLEAYNVDLSMMGGTPLWTSSYKSNAINSSSSSNNNNNNCQSSTLVRSVSMSPIIVCHTAQQA